MPELFARLEARFGDKVESMTRRRMLQTTLALSAGLLLSDACSRTRPRLDKHVVIVGAGFAGLAAAYELTTAGYDARVVEAGSRVGGRVLTLTDLVPGKRVEGGGEFIGSNHPTWVAYASKFGLPLRDVGEERAEAPIVLGGRRLTRDEGVQLFKEINAAVASMTADAAKIPDPFEPWTAPNAAALDRRSVGDWLRSLNASPLCKAGLEAMFSDDGVALDAESYLGSLAVVKGGGLQKYWTDSESLHCDTGNEALATKLVAGIGAEKIRLGVAVRRIDVTRHPALVELADGSMLTADDVVLAAPPSVWPKVEIEPALPPQLTLQMGSIAKFLVAVREPFWRSEGVSPESLTDGPVDWTWWATAGQAGSGDALCAFSGGTHADVCRSWPADERVERYLSELSRLYRGVRDSYVGSRFMDWSAETWIQAFYSCPGVGEVTRVGPILHDGLGALHFAGEHACYAFAGYMEGALNSGASLARKLAERDGVLRRGWFG
jgi:monoamine oxidase